MREKKSLSLVILFLLSFIAYGCFHQAVNYSGIPPERISNAILGSIDENDVISATARIALVTPDGYYPARAALVIKKPSYLRLELLPVIGVPDFILAASPEKMSVFIPSKGEFYNGRPTGSNLKKFLPWPIEIEDMVMIFTGTYPPLREGNISYQGYQENNLLRVEMKAPSGCSQIIWVQEEKNKLLKMIRNDETGKEIYNVKYVYDENQGAFPEKISMVMADGITSLSVNFSDVKIEKSADLSVFDLTIPVNVKEFILE